MIVWYWWKSLGWGAILYLAAIAGIDLELYEAVEVDGQVGSAKFGISPFRHGRQHVEIGCQCNSTICSEHVVEDGT